MKKFLVLVLAVWLILPAMTTNALTIPYFTALNPQKVRVVSEGTTDDGKGRTYIFEVDEKRGRDCADWYVNQWLTKHNFKIVDSDNDEFAKTYWLIYSGNERISTIEDYHIAIMATYDDVYLQVANGINFGNVQNSAPATTNTNTSGGSDAPDFGNIIGLGGKSEFKSGYVLFSYECNISADNANNYAAQYIKLLTSKYNFRQVDYSNRMTMSNTCQVDEWTFSYTGNKAGHLKLKRRRFSPKARIFANKAMFDIEVSQNLTYGNQTVKPAPRSGGGNICVACNGTGKCRDCGGSGFKNNWNGVLQQYEYGQCGSCLSSGNCNQCGGRGYL